MYDMLVFKQIYSKKKKNVHSNGSFEVSEKVLIKFIFNNNDKG